MIEKETIDFLTQSYPIMSEECKKYINIAVNALEKQIAKKPIDKQLWVNGITSKGICPSCECGVSSCMKCCDNCGQKLDWDDFNE